MNFRKIRIHNQLLYVKETIRLKSMQLLISKGSKFEDGVMIQALLKQEYPPLFTLA